MKADFDIERAPILEGVAHGFFGSAGGVHQFGYGGPGATQDVGALRAAAANTIAPGARVVAPHQQHTPDVITIAEGRGESWGDAWDDTPQGRPVADAVVTATKGMALGIVTADCAPVLLAEIEAGVIGAAHAGWRGAQGGVLASTVGAMEAMGADRSRIVAAIGPTIAQASYEVDAPFREHFSPEDDCHFAPARARDGIARWLFDLPAYVAAQLERAEICYVDDLGRDTFTSSERYHSYRRASSRGEPNYGRQIALIAL
ncbi:MAG: polyphenol oxidase family protein [Pseudomonadota bacterium]